MWMERFRDVWNVAASIAPFLGIIGFVFAARRDRLMLTTTLGLLACALSAFAGYRLASWDAEGALAEGKRKDQRIAQLEAQLAGGAPSRERSLADPARRALAPGSPLAAPAARPCPLNDTWECAEPLAFGQKDTDEFRASDEERYYYVDFAEPRAFTLTLDPVIKSRYVVMSVHDSDRREINQRSYSAGSPGSLDSRVRAAGRYFIRIKLGFCCVREPELYTISLAS